MPEPLTPEEIEAVRERCNAATEGPWKLIELEVIGKGNVTCPNGTEFWTDDGYEYSYMEFVDARFIAHSRTDIPALLATIDAQRAKIERVEALPEKWRNIAATFKVAAPNLSDTAALCADELTAALKGAAE